MTFEIQTGVPDTPDTLLLLYECKNFVPVTNATTPTPTTTTRPSPPTVPPQNWTSNKFSQTHRAIPDHKHITKNKLTGGYRKRPPGSRDIDQNVFSRNLLFVAE